MNKSNLIKLRDYLEEPIAIGNQEGREVYQALLKDIDKNPQISIFEISLAGVNATDASFPRESIVSLAKNFRGEKSFLFNKF